MNGLQHLNGFISIHTSGTSPMRATLMLGRVADGTRAVLSSTLLKPLPVWVTGPDVHGDLSFF